MQVEDRRTRSFFGIIEPPRWNTGIWKDNSSNEYRMVLHNDSQADFKEMYEYQQQIAYRANSNRNVKILSSIVLLEGVDVIPNLKAKKTLFIARLYKGR